MEGNGNADQVDIGPEDVFSDKSNFYGDEEQKARMKERAATFDPDAHRSQVHPHLLSTIACQNRSLPAANSPAANDVASSVCWQPTETVPEFLARLPPSTTHHDAVGPWLFVRNPASKRDRAQIRNFIARGTELLRAFENEKAQLEAYDVARNIRTSTPSTGRTNTLLQKLESDLLAAARNFSVTTGKWMLFPPEDCVDEMWAIVAGATARGELGIGAKVATNTDLGDTRLIAVYTQDYEDMDDVQRVLRRLVTLGLIRETPIYYKLDAYTHLDIKKNNLYGLRATRLSSRDVLKNGV